MKNSTDTYSMGFRANLVPEKKGLLDEMEDLERKRAAKKTSKNEAEKVEKKKSDLDLDFW